MSKNKHQDHEDPNLEDEDAVHQKGQKGHQPLKDPAAGTPPALVEGHDLTKPLPEFNGEMEGGVLTAAEEQRRRAQHIEEIGVEAYKREIASPDPLLQVQSQGRPQQVPGVSPVHKEEPQHGHQR